jgi:hypothetical protein
LTRGCAVWYTGGMHRYQVGDLVQFEDPQRGPKGGQAWVVQHLDDHDGVYLHGPIPSGGTRFSEYAEHCELQLVSSVSACDCATVRARWL